MENPYDILGIEKNSSIDTVTKAFRSLAKKYHPDKNQNNLEDATKKFKEINDAYEYLSDVKKKEFLDKTGRRMDDQNDEGFPGGPGGFPGFPGFPGGPGGFPGFPGGPGGFPGFPGNANFFNMGLNPDKIKEMKRQKLNINIKIELSLEQLYQGFKHTIRYNKIKIINNIKTQIEDEISFEIKPGFSSKEQIELKNKGNILIENNDEITGSLIINIQENVHKIYERDDKNPANLICKREITFIQALCGFQLILDHPSNKKIVIDYNDIIVENKLYKMNNKGMPIYNNNKNNGDLILKFNIIFPKEITNSEKIELSKIFKYNPKSDIEIDDNYLKGFLIEYDEEESENDHENESNGQHFQSVQCAQN